MCNAPIQITTEGVVQRVACGHCQRCARRRTMSWTLRLLLETTEHASNDFLTLTYREATCPEKLDTRHFETFIKALRRSVPTPVRYFCCGEYGGKTGRPHWHVLLYGLRLHGRGLFHIKQWPHGHVFTGEIEPASAQYVCRYTLKGASKSFAPNKEQVIRASRRPGIGMTSLRRIASAAALKAPEMAYFPPVMTYGKKSYWLDRRAYEACVDAYVSAGGRLSMEVAPNNLLVEDQVRSLPIDTAVRQWMRLTHGKV